MTELTAHRIEPNQLRDPLRAFGLPVDHMDDDAISSAAVHLYGVGVKFASAFAHLVPAEPGSEDQAAPRLRKLAEFCEAIEGMAVPA